MRIAFNTITAISLMMILSACTNRHCSPYCQDSERYNPGRIDNACVSFCVDTTHSLDQCSRDCKR